MRTDIDNKNKYKMNKKQRNKIYKKVLNKLSEDVDSFTFRICIELILEQCNKIEYISNVKNLFPEFYLFINEKEGLPGVFVWHFFNQENPGELRVFALQLCIEMTNEQ